MGLEMPTQYLDACEHLVADVAGEGAHFPHFLGQVAGGRARAVHHRALHDGRRLHLAVERHLLLCFCRQNDSTLNQYTCGQCCRSRIRIFWGGLPDPDLIARGTDTAPEPTSIKQKQ